MEVAYYACPDWRVQEYQNKSAVDTQEDIVSETDSVLDV